MRKIRLISIAMSVLSCVCIFSVGFSSWFSLESPAKTTSGSYDTYGVLSIENTEMTVFQFSALSFKDENYEDTDEGVISVKYKIPKESVKAVNGNFVVDISLGYSGISDSEYKLFKNAFAEESGNNYYVKVDGDTIVASIAEDDTISFQKTFDGCDQSKDFEFTVTYIFDIPNDDANFRNTFGKYLVAGGTDGKKATTFTSSACATPN